MVSEAPLGKRALLDYSLIALPLSFAGLPLYIHMPDFYATEFGINLGVLGTILLAIRLFDAVQDPFIGYLSDQKPHQRGAILVTGAGFLTIGLAGLCMGPPAGIWTSTWFALSMILATTGYSVVSINITMLGGFWQPQDAQKARISAWREGFGLLGLLIAAILPPALQTRFDVKISFLAVFLVFVLWLILAGWLFQKFMRSFPARNISASGKTNQGFALYAIFKGKDKLFLGICFLSYLSASLPAALVLFFTRDYLQAEELSGLFLALYFIAGAAFISLWSRAAKRYGLYQSWLFAMLLSVITFIGAAFLSPGDIFAYAVICILSGIALGADLALPPAMIAGRINGNKAKEQATQYYAVLALLPKLSMALATGVSFIVLEKGGFQAGQENSDQALFLLLVSYAAIPCCLKTLTAGLLWGLIRKEGHHHENTRRSIDHGATRIS